MDLDITNMCSHLQKKLFSPDGEYHGIWLALQEDGELTAIVRNRQLHIYRNGKKNPCSGRKGSTQNNKRRQT